MFPPSEIRFRSSAHVDLRRLDELPADQRGVFRDLEEDPDLYGLFVTRPPLTANFKAVPRAVAELFLALREPAPLGDAFRADDALADELAGLVLDGIFEVESGGAFVWGVDALPMVCPSRAIAATGATARLSLDALLYAQDLESTDAKALTTALYQYNRIPISPSWRAAFASPETILAYLGADRDPLRTILARDWTRSPRRGWLLWASGPRPPRGDDDVTFKLYVSPRPERIRDAFEVVVRVLGGLPRARFKIGDSAAGLLRPDKLVSYFETRDALEEAAEALRRELAGCDAQGVPFTAALDDSGLLSWGVDPPDSDRVLRWRDYESWRFWLAQRLGGALASAKRAPGAAEPWRFAIERVRRYGVDVENWTPSAALWSNA